ncbi:MULTISPECIES: helix-turn-helix domain-containing protein [Metallosphaera]|uniref:Transcriptional regulator, HxlR family n=3 Tax=Metallosphaera TaxID=41980 RepID=A4YF96_METS5|nr:MULTISPECIES: helix-turn-helix domain-containing protein [Metallosphaera]ABP95098.1 transcriptional regulator, HxlR family [Metallosphaera sedula DSM 5348]AIM27084.1 transcriptional regulator, HxlR family [Metallosphaera sedula]AKV73997.1 HxlR family transcriptional regulator [Metallosphaera sedula]AKV76236.1 HxlR family transcriptional regulator [Metallosphaera sedula]AKV78489.1 HxlR family transcriptional regulator [Metallosphaera sedula]
MDCCLKDDGDLCTTYTPAVYDLITKKYTLSILVLLDKYGKMRFSEILRKVDGLTQRALSIRLKELEHNGIVQREVVNSRPVATIYSLTVQGRAIKNAMLILLELSNLISPNSPKDYFC